MRRASGPMTAKKLSAIGGLGVFWDFWGSGTSSWPQIANRPSGHPAQSPATHLESLKTHKSSKS